MEQGVLREAEPADRASPVVVHGAKGGPCPAQLLKRLDEAPHGPSAVEGLDVMLELLGKARKGGVTVYLPPKPQKGFTLSDSINFQGVAWHAYRHEGPELNPLVAFGANSGFEGMVVGGLNGT